LEGGLTKWIEEGRPVEKTDENANEESFAYKLNS